MLISEKNQHLKSGYHPDSTSKTHFHVSKITKSDKILKKRQICRESGGKLKMRFWENTYITAIFTIPRFFLT